MLGGDLVLGRGTRRLEEHVDQTFCFRQASYIVMISPPPPPSLSSRFQGELDTKREKKLEVERAGENLLRIHDQITGRSSFHRWYYDLVKAFSTVTVA